MRLLSRLGISPHKLMMPQIYKHKAKAYAVLVKAGKYILSEDERENKKQELVPAEYVEAVAMELIEE